MSLNKNMVVAVEEKQDDNVNHDNQEEMQSNEALETTLGIAPTGLQFCFDPRGFLNTTFNEVAFILDRLKMGISLETLHDSLLQYFNILKNSLVELINQDYADFVNLSTNLFGLDKIIGKLEEPLISMEDAVSAVLSGIQETKELFEKNLDERKKLREKKETIHNLITIAACTTRLERWLSPLPASTPKSPMSAIDTGEKEPGLFPPTDISPSSHEFRQQQKEEQRIDRVAQEYTKLQYFVRKCSNHPFVEQELKSRIQLITASLQEQLEARLRFGLDLCHQVHDEQPDVDQLVANTSSSSSTKKRQQQHAIEVKQASSIIRQILSTYLSIDKLFDALSLYQQHVLRPRLSQIFAACTELSSSRAEPNSACVVLATKFATALEFLDTELAIFKTYVFKQTNKSYEPLSEFDVLVDAFFPEVTNLLFQRLPDIFSAGNPDRFFMLYSASLQFVDELESRMDSAKQVVKLRQHPAYNNFLSHWSLHVYFQLRCQHCLTAVTESLEAPGKESSSTARGCALALTETILDQIDYCWSEKVYLPALRHRFWKLTLQLVNVFAHSLETFSTATTSTNTNQTSVQSLLLAFLDGHYFLHWIGNGTLASFVLPTISDLDSTEPISENSKVADNGSPVWLTEAIVDSTNRIQTALETVKAIIGKTFQDSMQSLVRQVQDLPRQYRRTNREWPSTVSPYMTRIGHQFANLAADVEVILTRVQILPSFHDQNLSDHVKILFQELILQTTKIYCDQRGELLTSVKKVEDSLRRLREARSGGSGATNGAKSDDDKIRHQVHVDTVNYTQHLKSLSLLSESALEQNLGVLSKDSIPESTN